MVPPPDGGAARDPHAPFGVLTAACAQSEQHYPRPILLTGDEVLLGRTVNKTTGVCLPLAQVSSKHCRIVRCGVTALLPGGVPPLAEGEAAPAAYVVDTSTNGTFLNKQKLTKSAPAPLRDGDLVCFASPDIAFDKTVAFTFHAYDPAVHGDAPGAGAGLARGADAPAADAPAAKRARTVAAAPTAVPAGAHDASIAVDLHAANQALRQRNTELAEQVAALQAAAAAATSAHAAALQAAQEELAAVQRGARADAEEAQQTFAAERAVAESRLAEALTAAEADKARAATAAAAEAEAEAEAVTARGERDAAQARARDAEAALEATRAKLEGVQDAQRAALRSERDGTAGLREELSARDAALVAERTEKEAAQRRAERAAADADAAAAALQVEREKRAAAELTAAKACEAAQAAEAAATRLREETRGIREGGDLQRALQEKLIHAVRVIFDQAGGVLPMADALQQQRAQLQQQQADGSGAACVRAVSATAPESEKAVPTQQVPQPSQPAPSAPMPIGDTQDLDMEALAAAPQTLLQGSIGGVGAFPEPPSDTGTAAHAQHGQQLPPVDEGDDIPSASVQAEIDMVLAAEEASKARRQSDGLSQQHAILAANAWPY